MIKFRFLLLFLSISTFLFAQDAVRTGLIQTNPEDVGMSAQHLALLNEHIQKYVDEGNLPGGVFLLARKGKIVYYKNFGHTDLSKKERYEKNDIFRLASMTKAVTSVAIMQLFEKGKLGLDDPIFYYIPAFAKSQVLDTFNEKDSTYTTIPVKQPITIRHLLTHSSGLSYGVFNPGKVQAVYEKNNANEFGLSHETMTTEQMVNTLAKVPLIYEPGTQYMYGYNMEVLGRIVEVASGMLLNEYFKKYIFDPLGMDDTRFYLPKEKHDRLVPVYTYDENKKIIMGTKIIAGFDPDYPKWAGKNHFAGGGGLSGTAMDYAKFVQALCNGGSYNGARILGKKTVELIASDQMMIQNSLGTGFSKLPGITYGLGFALITEAGAGWSPKSPGTYEWGGAFNTKFFIDPTEEMIFVGMTQIAPFSRPDFWNRLYAIAYGAIEQ